MKPKNIVAIQCAVLFTLLSIPAFQASAQSSDVQPRITQAVDEGKLTLLKGNTYPLARPEFDRGPAPANLPMENMLLVLKRSPAQEAALDRLMAEQLDKSSANFHSGPTPPQFGPQSGASDQDIQTITSWLGSHGFQIIQVTNGRTVINFSGNAGQVQQAFHTAIHSYVVNGEQHWANSTDPQIPTALTPVVEGVNTLHNFRWKPANVHAGEFIRSKETGKVTAVNSNFTFSGGCTVPSNNGFGVGPTDFATIYNVLPRWTANNDGTGVTIAVVGQTDINPQDNADFRSIFGLPASHLTITQNPNAGDPGTIGPGGDDDEAEADIDTQWSGAVAKGATLNFVESASTNTSNGVDLSSTYIVDQNLAPILTESYGACEFDLGSAGNLFYYQMWQQGAAEGISVFIAAGDEGSAACDTGTSTAAATVAVSGLQVTGFASTPFNVAVGGTDFNDVGTQTQFWSATNNPTTQSSALSYIPEVIWNDACASNLWAVIGGSTDPVSNCNNSQGPSEAGGVIGGGGGASDCTSGNPVEPAGCFGGYAKPSWQAGPGVPNDGKRDIPDVSLFAGNGFNGNFYLICAADQTGGQFCNASNFNDFYPIGGTSGSTPTFAAIIALVNQKTASTTGLGNANAVLYPMASSQPAAFHDITTGTIAVLCTGGSPNCNKTVSSDTYGILTGYNAGPGYDLATGLGSVDAANLVNNWGADSTSPNFNLAFSASSITIASPGGTGTTSLSVNATNGFSGTVTFSCSSLPTESSCSFTPPSVTGSGSTTVMITTTAASVMTPLRRPTGLNAGPKAFELCLVSIGLLWMAIQVKRRRWSSVSTTLAVFCLLGAAACGGGGSGGSGGTTPV